MRRLSFWHGLVAGVLAGWLLFSAPVVAQSWAQNLQVHFLPLRFVFRGEERQGSDREGYYHNGQAYVPLGFIYQGTTYVPLRYLAESLGERVTWDSATFTVGVGSDVQESPLATDPAEAAGGGATGALALHGVRLGDTAAHVQQSLGAPLRRDPGEYGLEWWIYHQTYRGYMQVGLRDGRVASLYTNGDFSLDGLQAGALRSGVEGRWGLAAQQSFTYVGAQFTASLSESDLAERPLVLLEDTALILYFDLQDGDRLTAVQWMDLTSLVQSRRYSLRWEYWGSPPAVDPPALTVEERSAVSRAYEQQVFDLTNSARVRRGLTPLVWNEAAAQVARGHSRDMLQNGFFAHQSPLAGSPGDRFAAAGLSRFGVGENIAMGYADSIDAHEGWMNSPGHRESILHNDFVALGVGIEEHHFTQNFTTWRP